MVVYTSAKVDVETQTQNLCIKNTTVYYYWELYVRHINGTVTETKTNHTNDKLYFKLHPDELDPGLYRLYVKIGYPSDFIHWMEESMYLKIEHPPPNTFIKGGTGRIIGKGLIDFDGRSGSYSLKNGPGDPSGLMFDWVCMNFVTQSIYKLLEFNIDPRYVFRDDLVLGKWYDTDFLSQVQEKVIRINASTLYTHVQQIQNKTGTKAKHLSVAFNDVLLTEYDASNPDNSTGYSNFVSNNFTNYNYTVNDTLPLTDFFSITCMEDMSINTVPQITKNNIILQSNNELLRNEFITFVHTLFSTNSTFADALVDFLEQLSESYLMLNSVKNVKTLPGMDNMSFFDNLEDWLDIVGEIRNDLGTLNTSIGIYRNYLPVMDEAISLSNYIGMDGFLRLKIDKVKKGCVYHFLDFLQDIYDMLFKIQNTDWESIKNNELNYTTWITDELIGNHMCDNFTGTSDGYAQMNVTSDDVDAGMGYMVYLRADNEGSVGYFLQYTQTIDGDPPELEIEYVLSSVYLFRFVLYIYYKLYHLCRLMFTKAHVRHFSFQCFRN